MTKTRTLEIRGGFVYYRGIQKGWLIFQLKEHFEIPENGKIRITIKEKENGSYRIILNRRLYEIYKGVRFVGIVCRKEFEQLFFVPKGHKEYDIISRG